MESELVLGVREDFFALRSAGYLEVWGEDRKRQEAFWKGGKVCAKAMWQEGAQYNGGTERGAVW